MGNTCGKPEADQHELVKPGVPATGASSPREAASKQPEALKDVQDEAEAQRSVDSSIGPGPTEQQPEEKQAGKDESAAISSQHVTLDSGAGEGPGAPYSYVANGPPPPPCEEDRMHTLRALQGVGAMTMDAPPDPEIESILKLVSSIFDVPHALVALFDDKRIFVRETNPGGRGFQRGDFPWRLSFCAWTMAQQVDQIMVIPDATKDARFAHNEMVTQPHGVRCYVGAPLVASNGHRLGTICFADERPRNIDASQVTIMANMAEMVVRHVEKDLALQLKKKDNEELTKAYSHLKRAVDCFEHCVVLLDTSQPGWKVMYANQVWDKMMGCKRAHLQGRTLGEVMEGSAGSALPGRAHQEQALAGKEMVIEDAKLKPAWLESLPPTSGSRGGGASSSLLASQESAHSSGENAQPQAGEVGFKRKSGSLARSERTSATARRRYVLKLRPADGQALDDDALALAVPSFVFRDAPDSDVKSGLYFMTVEVVERSAGASSLQVGRGGVLLNTPMKLKGLQLGHVLGSGSFGTVYSGTWFGTRVAVKLIDQDVLQREDPISGQHMEALLGSELRHPHIVATLAHAVHRTDDSATSLPRHQQLASLEASAAKAANASAVSRSIQGTPTAPLLSVAAASPSASSNGYTLNTATTATTTTTSAASRSVAAVGTSIDSGAHVGFSDADNTTAAADLSGDKGDKGVSNAWATPLVPRRGSATGGTKAGTRPLEPLPEAEPAAGASTEEASQQQVSGGPAFGIIEVPPGYQFPDTAAAGTLDGFMHDPRHGAMMTRPTDQTNIMTGDSMLWSGGEHNHNRAMLSPPQQRAQGPQHRFLQTPSTASGQSGLASASDYPGASRPRPRQQTWLVLEFCDKGCLQDAVDRGWLRESPNLTQGRVSMAAVVQTAFEVASALLYLHSHDIVHGDLSAYNVLLTTSGTTATSANRGFVAKVADFGLARSLDIKTQVQTKTYGTLSHMPPELLADGMMSKAVDVYSFGVLLWQMLTGCRPWTGLMHAQIIMTVVSRSAHLQFPADAPQDYVMLASACLDYDSKERPTMADVCATLEALRHKYVL